MYHLFESSDILETPIECFDYDTATMPFPVKPHWHYFMEIILVIEGSAEMQTGEARYVLHKGDMMLFHPKSVHGIFSADNEPLKYLGMKFDINQLTATASYAPKLRSIFRCAERRAMPPVFPANFQQTEDLTTMFWECINEMRTKRYGYDWVVRSKIYILLTQMLRYWQSKGFSVDSETFAEDAQNDIYNITEYIDMHICDGIRVNELADRCGMSYSYFAKRFQEIYGKSCKAYIETMRLFQVEEFLLFTDFDLNYISQETGFSDCSHMIKSFKRSRGITPKQFRKQRTN